MDSTPDDTHVDQLTIIFAIWRQDIQLRSIPCAGHSLNLFGKNATECCTTAVSSCNSCMYFTCSTHCFSIL